MQNRERSRFGSAPGLLRSIDRQGPSVIWLRGLAL